MEANQPVNHQNSTEVNVNARDLLDQYFTRLEAGDFVEAANCFSESARYSHPPYSDEPAGSARHEALGREEILRLFRRRGMRSTHHKITAIANVDDRYFISGTVTDSAGSVVGSFLSEATFDAKTSQFTSYAAYSSRPAVWAANDES
ncbi:MAG: hypothetical protein EOP16_02470 [Pseudonocardia sp.]|nr:MAG: hypothetical protein EOP16_02470 [Pseudonocardia sp.]